MDTIGVPCDKCRGKIRRLKIVRVFPVGQELTEVPRVNAECCKERIPSQKGLPFGHLQIRVAHHEEFVWEMLLQVCSSPLLAAHVPPGRNGTTHGGARKYLTLTLISHVRNDPHQRRPLLVRVAHKCLC